MQESALADNNPDKQTGRSTSRSNLRNKTDAKEKKIIQSSDQRKKLMFNVDKIKNKDNLETIEEVSIKNYNIAKSDLFFQDTLLQNSHKKTKTITTLLTKSETIISKLKQLKTKAKKANDITSINDIDWIISIINDQNLYDIDSNDFNSTIENDKNQNGLAYLMQYSHIENINQKAKDFKVMRSENKRSFSTTTLKINLSTHSTPRSSIVGDKGKLMTFTSVQENLVKNQLELIDSIQFDIFALNEIESEHTAIIIASEILSKFDFVQKGFINCDTLNNFITKVASCYDRKNVIYHNDLHAADVMQTLHTMITRGNLLHKMRLECLDTFAMMIGAYCHDLKHTGQNNTYHINARTKIALRYNDISVLENYHTAQTFKLLSQPTYDIFSTFKVEEYRIIRRRIIEGILSTDMSYHQKVLSNVKGKVDVYKVENGDNFTEIFRVENEKLFDVQQTFLNMCLHCSDVSNPAKPGTISKAWTKRVYDEFFLQGDLEKQKHLPVSLLCDRDTTDINKAMIGFIQFVVMPSMDILTNLIPEVKFYSENVRKNLIYYENEILKRSEEEKESEDSDSQSMMSDSSEISNN